MRYEPVMQLIGRLGGTLKFFPSDPDARIGIAEEIAAMAADEEQVRWLVGRLPKLFQEWPAMLEVRAVFCSKYKPKDGEEAYSSVYLDGIPSEKESLPQLPAAPMRQIASSEPETASPSIAGYLADVTRLKDMNRVLRGIPAPTVRDSPVVRITEANRITEADVKNALRDYRAKLAAAEIQVAEVKV